ncbi:phage head-tail adapter protein [Haematobacter missouriensis]|uniref:Phage head-tail adapter protein n=1 Tax=Haematobacter missouriensis TaxID=366616 RepID=A0A212AHV7_9RHOB|nr:phage head-tail adapter protein [Haematobacter missouriensis]OWJ81081.1 phage head-tail adapter protein [Haematobacter missouriensis]
MHPLRGRSADQPQAAEAVVSAAGGRNFRVAFDEPIATPNGQGGQLMGWTERLHAYARIMWLRGSETVIAARLAGRQPAVVVIPSSTIARLITTEWRMRDVRSGDVFNIRTMVESDDRADIELTVEKGVAV